MTTDRLDLNELRRAYDESGYVVIRDFLPKTDFLQLVSHLDRYVRDVVPNLPDTDAFYDDRTKPETLKQLARMEQDPFFDQYRQNAIWKMVATTLLGEDASVNGVEWFNKPPNTNHPTPAHQDNFYFCLEPPSVLTMWLALDDVDEENGCLRYVSGSHRLGIRPHNRTKTLGFSQGIFDYGDADRRNEIAIRARPNDLLIHHGNTIHRADPNCSKTRNRRSFAMVFYGVSAKRDTTAYQRYLDSAKSQHLEMGLKVVQ